jgi:hypothetical protein
MGHDAKLKDLILSNALTSRPRPCDNPLEAKFSGAGKYLEASTRLPSLRGALATKQSRGRVLWPLDCFAAHAMTVELAQQY